MIRIMAVRFYLNYASAGIDPGEAVIIEDHLRAVSRYRHNRIYMT